MINYTEDYLCFIDTLWIQSNFESTYCVNTSNRYALRLTYKSIKFILKKFNQQNNSINFWPINLKQSNEDNITNRFGNYDTNWNDCVDQDGGHTQPNEILSPVWLTSTALLTKHNDILVLQHFIYTRRKVPR